MRTAGLCSVVDAWLIEGTRVAITHLGSYETPELVAKNRQSHRLVKSDLDELYCVLFAEASL